jgi:hypothetical protein
MGSGDASDQTAVRLPSLTALRPRLDGQRTVAYARPAAAAAASWLVSARRADSGGAAPGKMSDAVRKALNAAPFFSSVAVDVAG